MNKVNAMGLAIGLYVLPMGVMASDYDGSKPMLCASADVFECVGGAACDRIRAEEVDAPRFLKVEVKKKRVSATRASGQERTTQIERTEQVDGKLILQGAEEGIPGVRDGLGWSMAIQEDSGKMVLTGSGDDVAFVIFGACTTL